MERAYLIGFMGSGKSTIGRPLAELLGWSFIDLDHYLENKFHKSISQIFEEEGESAFRLKEQQVLQEVAHIENVIIAAGGGTPCFFDNMQVMNQTGLTIYMRLTPEVLAKRLSTGKNVRPLIKDKSPDELLRFITAKLVEREHYYLQSAIVAYTENMFAPDFLPFFKK